jgi:hypothetical protein
MPDSFIFGYINSGPYKAYSIRHRSENGATAKYLNLLREEVQEIQ